MSKDSLLLQHQASICEGIQDSKVKYRKIVQAGISKWVSDFLKGNIEINSADDLKKLSLILSCRKMIFDGGR